MSKKITIEELATMVKRGFDHTATKNDLEQLRGEMQQGFFAVNSRLDLIREDTADLPAMREELRDLRTRVDLLEQKVGLAK